MQLTKQEYIALEILKNKDVGVGEAWEMAWEFLEKSSANTYTPASADIESQTADPASLDISGFYKTCIPQGQRVLEAGQVWFNWFRGYGHEIKSEELELGAREALDYGTYSSPIGLLAPSDHKESHQRFLENGWQWELLLEGERVGDCKERVESERVLLSYSSPIKNVLIDGPYLRGNALGVTVRTMNILKANNILTYDNLLKRSHEDLVRFSGMGKKGIKEIISELEKHGLYLGMLKVSE